MKAARILKFGPPNVIENDDLPRPEPAAGQLLVRVRAAGVGNWDVIIREGKFPQPLPLILGSELSGIVEAIGTEVSGFEIGDEVYGATNELFNGAYAEYALPKATMMAQKPKTLNLVEAASAPIVGGANTPGFTEEFSRVATVDWVLDWDWVCALSGSALMKIH